MTTTGRAPVSHGEKSERRTNALTPLHDEDLRAVAGARKAGKEQLEYLKVTMKDVLISSYTPSDP
jgi:hypothetical protein